MVFVVHVPVFACFRTTKDHQAQPVPSAQGRFQNFEATNSRTIHASYARDNKGLPIDMS